jgi:hypothetical protein
MSFPSRLLPLVLAGIPAICHGLGETGKAEFPAVRLTTLPEIDGKLAVGEWPAAAIGRSFFDDQTGTPAERNGMFWLCYTDEAIYFAARFQTDPADIDAEEYRENVSLRGNDFVELSLDPFGALSGFSEFRVSPAGAWEIDISGGRAEKTEWVGEIEAEGQITADGWQAEMRIPWSILNLPEAGTRDLRFNVKWNERLTQREYNWTFTNRDRRKTPVWQAVELPKISKERSISLLPYSYLGAERGGEFIQNSGLDIKTTLSPTMQAVGSINPDFRNIENEILSLDFSYFERLAGESRPFFQEGADLRGGQRGSSIFASQRLESFDTGVNIYGNLTDETQFAVLSTMDFGNESMAMTRVRHTLDEDTSVFAKFVGFDREGEDNTAGEASIWRRFGDYSVFAEAGTTNDQIEGTGHRTMASFSHRGPGMRTNLMYSEITPDYFPRIGYAPQVDMRGGGFSSSWEKPHGAGPVLETEFGVSAQYYDTFSGDPFSRVAGLKTSLTMRDGTDFDVNYNRGGYFGSDDEVVSVSLEKPRGDSYRAWEVGWTGGEIAGDGYRSIRASAKYRPWKRVQLGLRGQWVSHTEDRRQIILSASFEQGKYESFGGRLVERDGDINWYLSWRRSGGRGAEYFLIVGDPNADSFQHSAILKGTWPIELKF